MESYTNTLVEGETSLFTHSLNTVLVDKALHFPCYKLTFLSHATVVTTLVKQCTALVHLSAPPLGGRVRVVVVTATGATFQIITVPDCDNDEKQRSAHCLPHRSGEP